jgi:uncharacterized OsmC-like protein
VAETRVTASFNGVNLPTIVDLATRMDSDPRYAEEMSHFSRRVRVRWVSGLHSQAYTRDVPPHGYDEPGWLGGANAAMAASEALLGAIGGCIAVGVAAQAALREVTVEELEIEVEGTIDLPAFFGIRESTSGYTAITVTIYIKCGAEGHLLDEILYRAVNLSPVVNTVRQPVDVRYTVKAID